MRVLLSALFILLSTSLYAKKAEFEVVWQKAFGDTSRDKAQDVIALKDGGIIVAGSTRSYGKGRDDMFILRMDKSGKTIYRSAYGGKKRDFANGVARTSDGNFIAVGSSESFSKDGNLDVYVVKFDKDGKRAWQKTFGGDEKDEAKAVVAVNGGGVLVAGYTESFGKGRKDVYILYIDKDGKEIWSKVIGGKEDDIAYDITLTVDGGFVVAGKTKSFKSKHSDIDIIKYSKDGKEIWHKIFGFKSKEKEVLSGQMSTEESSKRWQMP